MLYEDEGVDWGFWEGEQFCNSCGFVEAVTWCSLTAWYLHLHLTAPPGGVSQEKKQPGAGKDSLTSLLGQTGVFFNHSLKALGNPGLCPRSAGISLALWCCCGCPMETPVEEGEWVLAGCSPGLLGRDICENDLCGRNWTKKENCFILIAISSGKPGGELPLTGS